MHSTRRVFLAAVLGAFALSGCTDPVATAPTVVTTGLSARINGVPWSADSTKVGANVVQAGNFQFAASTDASNYALSFNFEGIGGVGTYALGTSSSVGGGTIAIVDNGSTKRWVTPASGSAGTLTITELNSSRITGTFSFVATAVATTGATGNITVTEGTFDVPIRLGVAIPPLPANAISKMHTKILGADFTPSSLQGYLPSTTPGNFAIAGGSSSHYFVLFLADITGPGTYQLDKAKTRWMHVGIADPVTGLLTQQWIGYSAGITGSVTITSITSGRVVGTFTATIQPSSGGSQAPLTISGDFDVGRLIQNFP